MFVRGQAGLGRAIWTDKEQQIPTRNLLLCNKALQREREGSYAQGRGGARCK